MFAVIVQFKVPARHSEKFGDLILKNAAVSLKEEGCYRFDVCTSENGEDCFLYELYEDKAAFDKHLETPHFKEFGEAISSFMCEKSARSYDLVPNPYAE